MTKRFGSFGLVAFLVLAGVVLAWLSFDSGRSLVPAAPGASQRIERVICIHPAVTELFYVLGQEDRLVAVSNFCTVPSQTQDKPKIGDTVHPDLERMRALCPDLVIVSGEIPTITHFCETQGLPIINLHMEGIDGIMAGIQHLGELLDESEQATQLCVDLQQELDEVRQRVVGQTLVPTFFAFYRTPGSLAGMTTAGAGTYIDQLICLAGGQNIFADVTAPYPQISKEALLKRQPQVILEPRDLQGLDTARRAALSKDWQYLSLPAVTNQRIYFPDQDLLLRPGPRVGQAARELARMLHPECFDE